MKKLWIVLEMIKFEHTLFALPFAFLGAFLAARGFPGWDKSLWILLAMFGARSAAMAFNRLADARFDSQNPRTSERALPRGLLDRRFVYLFVLASSALFFFSAWMLSPMALLLSPLALAIVLLYSYTKRFTSLSHLFLGLSLAVAPVGGWVAVRGRLEAEPFLLAVAVLCWVAGFDVIYACQDSEFDRKSGLYSIPARYGIRFALGAAVFLHIVMLLLLLTAYFVFQLALWSAVGIALVVAGLVYEHSLVKPDDLSKVNVAFFTVNGIISVVLFAFVSLDLCLYA